MIKKKKKTQKLTNKKQKQKTHQLFFKISNTWFKNESTYAYEVNKQV